jgi:two-component system, OmpR family, sensor histidine kinase TctE
MIRDSLRRLLTIRIASLFVVVLFLDSVACYYIARQAANAAYDSWLVDSARSLFKAMQVRNGAVSFAMQNVGLDVFQFDELDKTYFRVSSQRQGFIAGEPTLPDVPAKAGATVRLGDTRVANNRVRVAVVETRLPESSDVVTIRVGETLIKRDRLASQILLDMVAPQVGLLLGALVIAWLGVSAWLRPLTDLAHQIEQRDQHNLQPVPVDGLPDEARALVDKINDLLQRLERAMLAQKRFVADAAHQLRTPISAILLYAANAQRDAATAVEQSALKGLRSAAERTARLGRQLLSLARAEPEAKAVIVFEPVDLSALARDIGEEFISRAVAEDIDFGLVVPDAPVIVNGNRGLLADLLSNLIDNALRYGGHGCSVTVTVQQHPLPTILVEDNGPGIPLDQRQHVFERFRRLEDASNSGCGLGLAIVAEIAKLHGAAIEIQDVEGNHGVRFVATFPAITAA